MNYSSEEDLSDVMRKCTVSEDAESEAELLENIIVSMCPPSAFILTCYSICFQPKDEESKLTAGRQKLYSWLNNNFRIKMTDGRILIGVFLCTDANANVILGMCSEFTEIGGEERVLGLVMVPGKHIVSMEVDMTNLNNENANKNINSTSLQ